MNDVLHLLVLFGESGWIAMFWIKEVDGKFTLKTKFWYDLCEMLTSGFAYLENNEMINLVVCTASGLILRYSDILT